jgi:hypothetical protein
MPSQAWLKGTGYTMLAFHHSASAAPCMRLLLTHENMMADGLAASLASAPSVELHARAALTPFCRSCGLGKVGESLHSGRIIGWGDLKQEREQSAPLPRTPPRGRTA